MTLKEYTTKTIELEKREAIATKKVDKALEARMSLPIGSSRARVTTANARLFTWIESRQRIWDEMERLNNIKEFEDEPVHSKRCKLLDCNDVATRRKDTGLRKLP